MIYPTSIYFYQRHKKDDGTTGTRWNYSKHIGKKQSFLVHTLKRTNAKIIYYGHDSRKGKTGLWRGKNGNDTGWLSEVFQPDIKNPRLGFGDLKPRENTALLFREDTKADKLIIMVFEGQGNQSQVLFNHWLGGAISETVPSETMSLNNNYNLDTETVNHD